MKSRFRSAAGNWAIWVCPNRLILLVAASTLLGASPLRAFDPPFLCFSDRTDRILGIEVEEGGKKRPFHTIVFEEIGSGERFRKLHEVELVNSASPLMRHISPDGRFLVTADDFKSAGIGDATLVVYDLVRKEHTAWSGKDIFSREVLDSLKEHRFIKGVTWMNYDGAFNLSSTRFYTTSPADCREYGLPFVVIDLPKRAVLIGEVPEKYPPDVLIRKTTKLKRAEFNAHNGWLPSTDHTESRHGRLLPKRLLRSWPTDRENEVYEYEKSSGDYVRVSAGKWTDEDPWSEWKEK